MALHRFVLADIPATPWKNGGGSTQELACWPPGAGFDDFAWRASLARVTQAGPFSRFAGVDRVIALYSGGGMLLRNASTGAQHRLDQTLQPLAFAGEDEILGELLDGPCSDINLMLRRGRWRGGMQVLRAAAALHAQSAGLLLAVQGDWRLAPIDTTAAAPQQIAQSGGLWWADEACAWQVEPQAENGVLLHMQLHTADDAQ